jgi:hypothetical protein
MRTAEHALKLESINYLNHRRKVCCDSLLGRRIVFIDGQLQQSGCVLQPSANAIQRQQHRFQARALPPQRFGFFRVVPDCRVLEFLTDLVQAIQLIIEVKDTP